jgi:uncharacterized protein (DUF1330 family)
MINILVTLEVKNFARLADFEAKAVQVMHAHGGCIVRAFETVRNDDESGQEIHLLEFLSVGAFNEYRADSKLLEYAELRDSAIAETTVIISDKQKEY